MESSPHPAAIPATRRCSRTSARGRMAKWSVAALCSGSARKPHCDAHARPSRGASSGSSARNRAGRRGGAHAPERAPGGAGWDSRLARPSAAGSPSSLPLPTRCPPAGGCAATTCPPRCPPLCPPPGRPPPRLFSFTDWEILGTDGQKPSQVSKVPTSNTSVHMRLLCQSH